MLIMRKLSDLKKVCEVIEIIYICEPKTMPGWRNR